MPKQSMVNMKKKEIMLSRSKSILNNFMTKYWQLKVQEMAMKRNIHKEYDEREYFAVSAPLFVCMYMQMLSFTKTRLFFIFFLGYKSLIHFPCFLCNYVDNSKNSILYITFSLLLSLKII